jgi:hypothetical protein
MLNGGGWWTGGIYDWRVLDELGEMFGGCFQNYGRIGAGGSHILQRAQRRMLPCQMHAAHRKESQIGQRPSAGAGIDASRGVIYIPKQIALSR